MLSPFWFNVFLDGLLRELKALGRGIPFSRGDIDYSTSFLAYADDLVLLAETGEHLQEMLDVCSRWADRWGMEFAPEKSCVMRLGHGRKVEFVSTLKGVAIPVVDEFEYLGVSFKSFRNYKYLAENTSSRKAIALVQDNCRTSKKCKLLRLSPIALWIGYGVFEPSPASTRLAMKYLKSIIRCPDKSPTERCLEFVGWNSIKDSSDIRMLSLVRKLFTSTHPIDSAISTMLRTVVVGLTENRRVDHKIRWFKRIEVSVQRLGVLDEMVSLALEGNSVPLINKLKSLKSEPHPLVRYCLPFGHLGLLFYRDYTLPGGNMCPICNSAQFSNYHLAWCRDVRVAEIVQNERTRTLLTSRSWDDISREEVVRLSNLQRRLVRLYLRVVGGN